MKFKDAKRLCPVAGYIARHIYSPRGASCILYNELHMDGLEPPISQELIEADDWLVFDQDDNEILFSLDPFENNKANQDPREGWICPGCKNFIPYSEVHNNCSILSRNETQAALTNILLRDVVVELRELNSRLFDIAAKIK